MAMPNVEYLKHDAFTLRPEDIGKIDWLCSDVICYPPRLLEWIERWLASGLCRNFVCTIKMQGEPDRETTSRFAAIPGSKVVHLHYNKHELTWIKTDRPINTDN
jgi:23S rRNA (cytidine2498-2'-O)-methyltransferase